MPVYVFGSGDCGQLGMGEDMTSALRPTPIPAFEGVDIIGVAAGGLHSIAISSDGQVFSWGCNDEKALGHTAEEFQVGVVPFPVESRHIIQICAGDSISAALTERGQVYTWGTFRDSQGVLGHSQQRAIQELPQLLQQLSSLHVTALSAGANHLVALTADHAIYSWGCGEQGQLGRRISERHKSLALRPTNVTPRRGRGFLRIIKVVCGSYHTLALAEDGSVHAMGLNNYGQLGLGDHEPRPTPTEIPASVWQGKQVIDLGAGEHHSLALCSDGTVFAFGRHDFGQLGIVGLSERAMNSPHIVNLPCSIHAIAVGGNHNLALHQVLSGTHVLQQAIFSWGYGEMAQLGHGVERDEKVPREMQFPWRGHIAGIAAGGQHSIVLTR